MVFAACYKIMSWCTWLFVFHRSCTRAMFRSAVNIHHGVAQITGMRMTGGLTPASASYNVMLLLWLTTATRNSKPPAFGCARASGMSLSPKECHHTDRDAHTGVYMIRSSVCHIQLYSEIPQPT